MPRPPLVVFDFDGTLAETREAVSTTLNHVLYEAKLPRVHPPAIHSLMGLPLTTLIRRIVPAPLRHLPHADPATLADAYRTAFDTHGAPLVRAFDEVPEVLQALHDAGHTLAIATSRARHSVQALLDQLGLTHHFAYVAAGDDPVPGKPAPDLLQSVLSALGHTPEEALMVGDTDFDVAMAQAAGVPVLAVSQGCHDADRLARAQPTFQADSLHAVLQATR